MDKQQISGKNSLKEISDKVDKTYDNFILENVNDHCLRIAVMQGEYRWHYHKNTDELFVVLEGELKIEIKDNDAVFIKPGECINNKHFLEGSVIFAKAIKINNKWQLSELTNRDLWRTGEGMKQMANYEKPID